MPAIHSDKPHPVLADVQCTRLQFQPGDRILVRVKVPLDEDRLRKLRKTVERWSGGICEVLVIDETVATIEVKKALILKSGV